MGEQGSGERSLIKAYVLWSIGALGVALVIATAGDWWQHQAGDPALLLLPVSNVTFWFIPLAGAACAWVAIKAGRPSGHFVASAAIASVACVWSMVLWRGVGRQLGPQWTSADLASIMAERGLERLAGGSLADFQ